MTLRFPSSSIPHPLSQRLSFLGEGGGGILLLNQHRGGLMLPICRLRLHPKQVPYGVKRPNQSEINPEADSQSPQGDGPIFHTNAPIPLTDVIPDHNDHGLMQDIKGIQPFIDMLQDGMWPVEVKLTIGDDGQDGKPTQENRGHVE